MQQYFKKFIEEVIDWAVPVLCAGALLAWKNVPAEMHHYWPVICISIICLYSLLVAFQSRREVKRLRLIHEQAQRKEAERRKTDENIAKAFRAMLDDDMGNLYAACVAKGYTTEDERRRFKRLHTAYKGVGGNGEADRRNIHFDAIPDEEEWKAHQAMLKACHT